MIPAKELRIGNKVKTNSGIATVMEISCSPMLPNDQIVGLHIPPMKSFLLKNTDFEPIPLTEEILQSFGFVTPKNYHNTVRSKDGVMIDYHQGKFILRDKRLEISSVHQLQNLYFALTGQEIEPKL